MAGVRKLDLKMKFQKFGKHEFIMNNMWRENISLLQVFKSLIISKS